MRIKRDGTGRQVIVNHEHSGETTSGTWVSGMSYFLIFKFKYFY